MLVMIPAVGVLNSNMSQERSSVIMFVAPSAVLYTTCPGAPGLEALASDRELEEMGKKLMGNSEGLKLQVVQKDGRYFTLNNTRLQVCQWLETRGQCRMVRIETVPLKSVPDGIKRMMFVPASSHGPLPASANEPTMTFTYEPMEQQPRTEENNAEEKSGSDVSDCGDSDSSDDEFEVQDEQHQRRRHSGQFGNEENAGLIK